MHIKDIIPKSLVPQRQDLKLPETSDPDDAFIVAVNDTKVKNSRQEDLKEVLRLIMVKVGLRANNWPKDEEKAVLLHHIITNYGGHTPKEILLAFEMGIRGELDVEMNHYENFSCLYFSNVMNAYREYAKEAYKINIKEAPMIEHKEDTSEAAMQTWYNDLAQQVRDSKLKLEFMPAMISDWLIKNGTVKDWEKYQVEAAVYIGKELAKNIRDSKGMEEYRKYKAMFQKGCFEGDYIAQVQTMAKKMAAWDYILKTK
jgi:hypothetical protein